MAFWQKKQGKVYVLFWDTEAKKQRALPRKFTKHLDSQPDSNIETWVANYELTHEKSKKDINKSVKTDSLQYLIIEYLEFRRARGTRKPTVDGDRTRLQDIAGFFESIGVLDPELWPNHTMELWKYFQSKQASHSVINCSNVALRGFWEFLQTKQLVTPRPISLISSINRRKKTPLKFTISPAEILNFAMTADPTIAFMALCGFFMSLRPQETFALTKKEFVAGPKVAHLNCVQAMTKSKLYGKLVVDITCQLAREGLIDDAKSGSTGWVACFNEVAAKQIVKLVNEAGEGRICKFSADYLGKIWGKKGYPGLTLKDLRRSSIYWLGHNSDLTFAELQNHARHLKAETTALYIRRPDEELKNRAGELSLD